MARITVEDCIDKFPSRFELVLVSSQRARKLYSGEKPTVEVDNDKNTVIALREIADSTITASEMKENLIHEYQTVSLSDEEEEIFEIETFKQTTQENNESQLFSTDVEEEINELISSEDSEIKEQYEIKEGIEENTVSDKIEENTVSDEIEENTVSHEVEENTQTLE